MEPVGTLDSDRSSIALSAPVPFDFVPIDVIAKGRMEAGVRGIKEGAWVVTLGQNLLGSGSSTARVRPVKWQWVEQLQNLQREDLMQEMIERQKAAGEDTVSGGQRHSSF